MAWTATLRGTGEANESSDPLVISSFTPGASRMLLALVQSDGDNAVSGVSGHGTWSQVFDIGAISVRYGEVWACFTSASPSAGTVTISKTGYSSKFRASIVEVHEDTNGVDMSGTVADAIGQTGKDAGGYDATPYQISLGAFSNSGNLTFVVGMTESSSGAGFSFEAGYTNLGGWYITPAYKGSEDNTVDVTSDRYNDCGVAAFEVKMATGGTTAVPTTAAPTTLEPTTLAPTTSAPTTIITTAEPTTVAPTTLAPTTAAPKIGTVCFGHDTGVVEDYAEDLSSGAGSASISGAGDNEQLEFQTGEEWISPVWQLGSGNAKISLNKYQAGDSVNREYKTGNSEANCNADSWHSFTPPGFSSLGYVRMRLYR